MKQSLVNMKQSLVNMKQSLVNMKQSLVIPAQAGIQKILLDSALVGNNESLLFSFAYIASVFLNTSRKTSLATFI